ncbi:MAG: hypothetical protein AAGU11_13355 [Syntrophobacteraceae bacterium]
MNKLIRRLQREAERIASKHPVPEFYTRFKAPIAHARKLFFNNSEILNLRKIVEPSYHEQLGHGFYHSMRVSIDSAALVSIEMNSARDEADVIERFMLLSLRAGILHDICRNKESHAECGADKAEKILCRFDHLVSEEIACIVNAIRNHEAFAAHGESSNRRVQLVSDCLYDADKFRWGPDTFTHTLWCMADHQGLSPRDLIGRFPWGMSGTYRILDTFRTPTGRQYGPQIIETGVEIGKEIYRYLLHRFREEI